MSDKWDNFKNGWENFWWGIDWADVCESLLPYIFGTMSFSLISYVLILVHTVFIYLTFISFAIVRYRRVTFYIKCNMFGY